MTYVIHKDPAPGVVKQAVCYNGCGATIGYVPNDIHQDYHGDYLGGKDYYNYVKCPCCSKQIIVK
jgi:hypothetical protein